MMLDSLRLIQLKVPHSTMKPIDFGRGVRAGLLLLAGVGLLGPIEAAPTPMLEQPPLPYVRSS